jgi:ribosomal protein L3 glutamine methyltransferase
LSERIAIAHGDLFAPLAARTYDLIVSNPPYVAQTAMDLLPAEYRHEPRLALAGGVDGLDVVRRILAGARQHLRPGGWLAVEVGEGRAALERAFPRTPFIWPETARGGGEVFLLSRDLLPA